MNFSQVGGVDTASKAINMKSRVNNIQEETVKTEEKNMKELLSDPMETVGRSQVNFRGMKQLSAKDLNSISGFVSKAKLCGEDIIAVKKALVEILNKENCSSLKEMVIKSGGGEDVYMDFIQNVMRESGKINKNADLDKIGSVASDIFLEFEKFKI